MEIFLNEWIQHQLSSNYYHLSSVWRRTVSDRGHFVIKFQGFVLDLSMQNSIYRFKLFSYRPKIESLPNWITFEYVINWHEMVEYCEFVNCVCDWGQKVCHWCQCWIIIIIIYYYYRLPLRFSFSYSIHGCWKWIAGNGFSYSAMKAKNGSRIASIQFPLTRNCDTTWSEAQCREIWKMNEYETKNSLSCCEYTIKEALTNKSISVLRWPRKYQMQFWQSMSS